jgi:lysophospholipase L1-like esterase
MNASPSPVTSRIAAARPRGRPRQLGRKLLLSLASVVVSCLVAEGVVRLVLGPQPKFPRRVVEGPHGLRINEPNAVYRHQSADVSVWFRINSKGLRADREYPYEKPAGTKRVVCLGDSFTAGYEVDLEDCFTRVLERELNAPGRAVEVLDAGVSGFGTAEELLYLERELIRYQPDVVVVSFYGNDLMDNVRSDLFGLDHGELVTRHDRYVPFGAFANFLNTNFAFNWLSGYSDAFAMAKETTTRLLKRKQVEENIAAVDTAASTAAKVDAPNPASPSPDGAPPTAAAPADPKKAAALAKAREDADYAVALTAALYERLREFCVGRGIALVIQSIPSNRENPLALVDLFPRDKFDVARPGVTFQSDKELLDPFLEKELLYSKRSTGHWTPFSHRVCGKALAARIVKEGLLGN